MCQSVGFLISLNVTKTQDFAKAQLECPAEKALMIYPSPVAQDVQVPNEVRPRARLQKLNAPAKETNPLRSKQAAADQTILHCHNI